MESSVSLQLPHFSLFPTKRHSNTRFLPFRLSTRTTSHHHTTLQCHKMYVPGFGEASPEAKAAKHLHDFFTYVAVRIVQSQLEDYNFEAYIDLRKFLEKHSLNDGDKFCADLMRESSGHKQLALRILEVRSAYCKNDFEWDNLKLLALKMVDDRNTRLMRDYVSETTSANTENEK